jgi:hypothetical protein
LNVHTEEIDTGIVEVRMDNRLAPLRHEIDEIMSAGLIGHWSNPPTTFAMMSETVLSRGQALFHKC